MMAAGYSTSPAMRDWETMDMRGEVQYVQDFSSTKQLTAAFENMNPETRGKKELSHEQYVRATLATRPSPGYAGPALQWPLVAAEVDAMVVSFATMPDNYLHAALMCRVLVEARDHFARMPPVTKIVTNSGDHKKLVVVGDLHGQLADLLTIFIENGFPSPTGTQYLFNGDFVDRGEFGAEVATILLCYALLYPNTVHLNRGNHETVNMNINYGFIDEVAHKFGSTQMFALFVQVWDNLPIATVIDNTALVLHGGLFRANGITLQHLNSIPKKDNDLSSNAFDMMLQTDVLWSDPQDAPGRQPGVRGSGTIQFGPDITQQFLRQNNLKLVIRSHQVPSTGRGYEVLHNGLCITVFSASNYCGSQGNHGGLVIFEKLGKHRCDEFWAPPLEVLAQELTRRGTRRPSNPPPRSPSNTARPSREQVDERARKGVLRQLEELITKRHADLLWYYKGCTQDARGHISIDDWRSGLSVVLQLNIDWTQHEKDLLHGAGSPVDWRAFLSHYKVAVADKYKGWQDEMKRTIHEKLARADFSVSDYFRVFDTNGDGQIDLTELQRGLASGLGLDLTDVQAEEFMVALVGPGGRLDVLKLLESLQMEYKGKGQPPEVQEVIRAIERTLRTSSIDMLDVFKKLDRDGDGKLSLVEFREFIDWLRRTYTEYAHFDSNVLAQRVMDAFDEDHSGTVSLLEFLDNFKPSSSGYASHVESLVQEVARALYDHKSSLKALFYRIDTDGDGGLTPNEFREGLRTLSTLDCKLSNEELELVARHADTNADGILSWHEFLEAFGLDAGETKFEALAETAHQRKSSIPSPRTTLAVSPPPRSSLDPPVRGSRQSP